MDKWLWAVRVYKTRSLATEACRAGHVKIGGEPVKPSRNVHVGEVITAHVGHITRMVKVLGLIHQRVSAEAARRHMEDLTPPEEYQKQRETQAQPFFFRAKGTGRPTKKDRRLLDSLAQ
jgi:ribosome-associated heat shock protein Hsp15